MSITINLGALPLLLDEKDATLDLPPVSDEEFYDFCLRNPLVNVERTAKGYLHFMPPVDAVTDSKGGDLFADLVIWNRGLSVPGLTFSATAAFKMPSGLIRAPDAAWLSRARWNALPSDRRHPYPYFCPDFVAEVMSPSDRIGVSKDKMAEYIEAGARLAWLVDRKNRAVYVYRPGETDPQPISDPRTLSGDPELPGFVADLYRVFEEE